MTQQMRPATGALRGDARLSLSGGATGEKTAGGAIMDSSEVFSQFSINRLDGEAVPDDLRILLPHRDELAGRSGFRLVLDEDWAPWLIPAPWTSPCTPTPRPWPISGPRPRSAA